jgi:hypothetical protein
MPERIFLEMRPEIHDQRNYMVKEGNRRVWSKEYEILRSPGSGASLLKMGQVSNYCAMHGICLLNRAISPTFLPLSPGHNSTTLP